MPATSRSRAARRRAARRLAALLAVAVAAAACGQGPTPAPASPSPSAIPASPSAGASPSASPSGPAASASPTPPGPGDRPDLTGLGVALETVAGGFDQPLFVTGAGDGSGRLFVVEQDGRIRIVRGGRVLEPPFLDITDKVEGGGERGLLGLAFPPGFGTERDTFYVHYSDLRGDTTLAEYRVASRGADTADPSSERILLTQQQPYANHNGGWIGFDPTGMLLMDLGDGGSGGDPENRASNLGTLLGKVLRLDVLDAPAGEGYAVPADNPFVDRAGARGEVLHYGLRNPWRASIDPATGDLWVGDVGQGAWEEVDVARMGSKGLDFGWRRWEGRHCYNPSPGCSPEGVTMPVAEYPHSEGCAIIGGEVYRGTAIPALRGGYLFSDECSGTLWGLDAGLDAEQAPITLLATGRNVSSFGHDEAGELYLTDLSGGELLRIVPGG